MVKRILFVPIHDQSMIEMLPVAERIVKEGSFEPVFFLFNAISNKNFSLLTESKFRVIGPQPQRPLIEVNHKGNSDTGESHFRKRPESSPGLVKTLVKLALSSSVISFFWYLVKFWFMISRAKTVLQDENVAAVVVIGDRHVGWETAMIKAANDMNIPSLIVPFAVSDPESDIEARLRLPEVKQYQVNSLIEKAAARRFPRWVRENGTGLMFFIPVGNALAARVLGMMPDIPWTIGGGDAVKMAVPSPKAFRTFDAGGVLQSKMVITGKPGDDMVYSAMQELNPQEIRAELGIQGSQRIILCSVPQMAEHGLIPWDEHWQETDFLFKTLSEIQGAVLVLSLHPQSNPHDYRQLAGKYGARLAERRIYELIPVCDVLVATYSSVVVQAIGCGKPAVVVDFYGLDYTYYDREPGVLVVKQREALLPTIERLLYNDDEYNKMVEAQLKSSPDWLLLDGKCTSRVVDELTKLIID
jgi:hypothetical protein